jgi:Endosomal/lysosomal potassium channel TMEM175
MVEARPNARLEAFCDGVFAIALTLLIIDIKLPSTEGIGSTSELWRALQHLAPSVFAFVLSFGIILITWVNHQGTLELVHKSSASFIYANGFLLLCIHVLFAACNCGVMASPRHCHRDHRVLDLLADAWGQDEARAVRAGRSDWVTAMKWSPWERRFHIAMLSAALAGRLLGLFRNRTGPSPTSLYTISACDQSLTRCSNRI